MQISTFSKMCREVLFKKEIIYFTQLENMKINKKCIQKCGNVSFYDIS